MTTDPTPAATARDALIEKCADAVWNAGHYTFGADLDDLMALAAAEAPGRVAALETALRSIAAKEPAPASPGCTCDPDSATDDDGNLVMCDLHEPMLRHLRWESLASLVIDYQAFMRHALAVADAALAAAEARPNATAVTARDALVAKVTSDWDADPYGEYEAARSRLIADLDNLIALGGAEAPGRVAALEALADQWEREAEGSGWMEQQPWRIRRQHASALRAALAAPASPAGVSGEVHHEGRCDRCGGVNVVWWADHDLWNAAGRTDGSDEWPFLCPSCFASVAEERGVVPAHTVWKMVPNGEVAQRTEPEVSTLPVAGSTPALPATPPTQSEEVEP